jgi:hypothetical protein
MENRFLAAANKYKLLIECPKYKMNRKSRKLVRER